MISGNSSQEFPEQTSRQGALSPERIPELGDTPLLGLDLQKTVAFGHPLVAAGGPGLDLSAAHRHGKVGSEGVLGLAAAMGNDVTMNQVA